MAKEIIFVNEDKLARAKEIVSLLTRAPKNEGELERKTKFSAFIANDKVAEEDQLEYVYVKLGGLVRTVEQQKVHEDNVEKIANKKGKKDN